MCLGKGGFKTEKKQFVSVMGAQNTKAPTRKVDVTTSNTSLSDLRYIVTEKPKWKVFKKTEIKAVPNRCHEGLVPDKGCNCGNFEPCRQRVTPKGVTIHYPRKYKKQKKSNKAGKNGKNWSFSFNFGTGSRSPTPKSK